DTMWRRLAVLLDHEHRGTRRVEHPQRERHRNASRDRQSGHGHVDADRVLWITLPAVDPVVGDADGNRVDEELVPITPTPREIVHPTAIRAACGDSQEH